MIDPVIFIDLTLSFLTLTLLEIALGIDNLVMIMILCGRLPKHQQAFARKVGLGVALLTRVMLLSLLFWMQHMVHPLFEIFGHPVSVQTILYFFGGLFLIGKATAEIHHGLEEEESTIKIKQAGLFMVLAQISMLDIVFSFDSVLTAIGLAEEIFIMVTAVVIATVIMVVAVDKVSSLLEKHPTLKILALSYMILIGFALLAEAFEFKIPKGYLYSAMAFSILVEWINIMTRNKKEKKKVIKPANPAIQETLEQIGVKSAKKKPAKKATAKKKAVKKAVKKK